MAQTQFMGEFVRLQIGKAALLRRMNTLITQESIGLIAASPAQGHSHGSGIDARAAALRAYSSPFLFFRHPGPHSLGFKAIEPDVDPTSNTGAISSGMRRYFRVLGGFPALADLPV